MKYILVTGGILSGIGKGIIASSTGLILKSFGLRVTTIKIDPYLNCDAGTMSPFEHGEVFVLDDGGEVDLDLGNYERFLDITLTKDHNITTGKIYREVIERERRGEYLGKTVQVIPHICDAIQEWIERVSNISVDGDEDSPDVCVIELGGTVGDIESGPFIEAMRQFQFRVGLDNFCNIHVSLVPVMGVVGEQKTKPTQTSVRTLRALGLQPDVIVCRSTKALTNSTKQKIESFCHAPCVSVHDVTSLFRVPLLLEQQGLVQLLLHRLRLFSPSKVRDTLVKWRTLADGVDRLNEKTVPCVKIAIVGKYTGLADAYLSVTKALNHAAFANKRRLKIKWIESSSLQEDAKNSVLVDTDEQKPQTYEEAWEFLRSVDGILVPGGFGDRGVEGKIIAANYARVNNIPYLGICLGMQIAVIEYARNVMGLKNANSSEFNPDTSDPVIIEMPEISKTHMGGTMRLGKRKTIFKTTDCAAFRIYGGAQEIYERHRHRYEVNPEYVDRLSHGEKGHFKFVGVDETEKRMEIIELEQHPFFLGTQFHPEFKSHPLSPSPPFVGFIEAAIHQQEKRKQNKTETITKS